MGVTSKTGIISVIYKKGDKKILQTTETYTKIRKNQLQKALDIKMGENHSASIKKIRTILHTLYTIRDINNVSKPFIELIEILSFQLCKSSDMEANLFT